jgi:hypothetical protein
MLMQSARVAVDGADAHLIQNSSNMDGGENIPSNHQLSQERVRVRMVSRRSG